MAKLTQDPNLPAIGSGNYQDQLRWQLDRLLRLMATQVNSLTEGRLFAVHNAATAPPTAGEHNQGDTIRNSAPTELGSGGSKYVITGWICVASGTPGTWLEKRSLTGN